MKIKGLSFSLKRAVGISGLKTKIAHKVGVPTTKQGLERKIGGAIINGITKKKKIRWVKSVIITGLHSPRTLCNTYRKSGVFVSFWVGREISISYWYRTKKIWRAICSPYIFAFFSDSDRIQTCNRLIRSQVLYSVELRSHCLIASANVRRKFFLCKFLR